MRETKFHKVILGAALICMLCIVSCNRPWYCSSNAYSITAIKGGDTIFNTINYENGLIYSVNVAYTDSVVNYYKANGYYISIDTFPGASQKIVNDRAELKALEEDGLTCTQPD